MKALSSEPRFAAAIMEGRVDRLLALAMTAPPSGALTKTTARAPCKKDQVALRLESDALERLRNAIWTVGHGLTVQGVLEEAALDAITALEKKHNGGKPFPQRKSALPKGK